MSGCRPAAFRPCLPIPVGPVHDPDVRTDRVPPELLGPFGLLIGLGIAVVALWRDHLRADKDDRDQRDEAFRIAHAQVAATNRVADSYASIAGQIAEIAKELAAVRRDMARRRREEP